jgi:tungstate transport system substrate-binding protein
MNKITKIVSVVLIIIIVAAIGAYAYTQTQHTAKTVLTVATTTSLHDTGLEDNGTGNIKAAFEAKYTSITVNFVALGTGAAIAQAQRGDADMILVHSPSQEKTFLTSGYGVDRKIIAYNFFVIVGPASDPAHISGMSNVTLALQMLYASHLSDSSIMWVSRNDASGTNTAEINLWKAAGLNYTTLTGETAWFKSTGSGMGATLLVCDQFDGYTLADTGTYLAYQKAENIPHLTTIIQSQQALLNVYSAIIDNPQNANLTDTHFDAAKTFISYLVSSEGQQLIANYGKDTYGQQLFNPFVPVASETAPNATLLGWIQKYAYINNTECPAAYRYNAGDLYSATYDALAASPQIQVQPIIATPALNTKPTKI